MSNETAIQTLEPATRTDALTTGDIYSDGAAFALAQRWAQAFSASKLVPEHLQGKAADCLVAFALARTMKLEPLTVLQNIHFVKGKPGWSAQFLIARANMSGKFTHGLRWRTEGKGADMSVTCYAHTADGEIVDATASMAMAQAEGWTSNSKYKSMPEQMLRYRSATLLVSLYCPEVKFGIPTAEELEDVAAAAPPAQVSRIKDRVLSAARHQVTATTADVIDEPAVDAKTAARVKATDALTDGTIEPGEAVAFLVGAGFSEGEANRIVEAALDAAP
jgi:hypothetical protein